MYLGTFLACLGALFLEIVATRVLGVVQGPETILYTVATAMLGMGAAGSLFSVIRWRPNPAQARKAAGIFCILAAISIVGLFAVATAWKLIDNERAAASFTGGGFDHLLEAIVNQRTTGALVLGIVLSIPYFFTGALLAVLFQSCRQDEVHRLYAVDLIGACIGCLLAIAALEVAGFVLPLALSAAIPLLAAAAYLRPAGMKVVLPLLAAARALGRGFDASAGSRALRAAALPAAPRQALRSRRRGGGALAHLELLFPRRGHEGATGSGRPP